VSPQEAQARFARARLCCGGESRSESLHMLTPISTKEKFPRTENFPKISLLKVENFQLQNFFPKENLCRPITFYKIFFLRKIFLSENGPLDLRRFSTRRNFSTESKFRHIHLCFMSSRAELIVKRQREISFRSKNSACGIRPLEP
jgi:hypothetical protein